MLAIPPSCSSSSRWICSGCIRNVVRQRQLTLNARGATSRVRLGHQWLSKSQQRAYSLSAPLLSKILTERERTRNIGIIAHIDAGKTTTTERMLYYSGFTRSIGDVDDGSTVTDFLPAERARGITIQSAAITFNWPPTQLLPGDDEVQDPSTLPTVEKLKKEGLPRSSVPHVINLIDTPGHADFTFEVLRSLRILDGAVCILDGVAGVEAQTEKVWHQASRYQIPRIVFVNKLDREGAAFGRTVKEIATKLAGWPVVCQIPWFEKGEGRFKGVGDAIHLRALSYPEGGDGKKPHMYSLEQLKKKDRDLAEEIKKARVALIELLSEQDGRLVECFLENDGDHMAVTPLDILDSLRRCLQKPATRIIPVFAGASFKNIGVQPLLDAVINLLPSPTERPDPEVTIGHTKGGLEALLSGKLKLDDPSSTKPSKKKGKSQSPSPATIRNSLAKLEACALAFKVVNDAKRGVLVYVRVYSGELTRNSALFNTSLQLSERGPRLLKMYANDAVEVASVKAGNIAVITGLKFARTGDTLLQFPGNKPTPPQPLNTLQLRPIDVPSAVFFASVEPHSLSEEKHLHEALALLLREDPSLHVTQDEESGQTLLSGMGELHLEIARDRLVKDMKAKASMGKNVLPSHLNMAILKTALVNGGVAALSRGPNHAYPMHDTHVRLTLNLAEHLFGNDSSLPAISAAARTATQAALREVAGSATLMEPVMNVTISVNEGSMGAVIHDISSARGGHVLSLDEGEEGEEGADEMAGLPPIDVAKVYAPKDPSGAVSMSSSMADGMAGSNVRQIKARVPLKEMVGYLKHLRSLTGGRGTFVMSVDRFEKMSVPRVKALLTEWNEGV
ncbi:elongation factor G [Ascosphaera apis ARSEF 7405]|uniref:Ribosome-releasing factor 2, mitochondrial n=1 Tax=Ascosphaera apis ARSEF 7405 TaxID=392613 RepID=A0A168AMA4_9EURO|nr:elongation factor G [Ascosphaera apis ARSEF 7405]